MKHNLRFLFFLPLIFVLSCAFSEHKQDYSFPVKTKYSDIDRTYNILLSSLFEANQEEFFKIYGNKRLIDLKPDLAEKFFNNARREILSFFKSSELEIEVEVNKSKNEEASLYKYKVSGSENSKQFVVSLLRENKSQSIEVTSIGFESSRKIK